MKVNNFYCLILDSNPPIPSKIQEVSPQAESGFLLIVLTLIKILQELKKSFCFV